MRPTLTADEVADYLIALAHQRGETVNNLKLQKLLYYAQAWYLAEYDQPLFDARFEAWMSGPVIPAIYWRFKPFGISPLPPAEEVPLLDTRTAAFLDDIVAEYLSWTEWELQWQVHREAPWLNAQGGRDPSEPSCAELSEDDMRAYFREIANAA
jgi:uncharacterized phage-associated protein